MWNIAIGRSNLRIKPYMNQMEVQVEMVIASNTIGNYFDVSYTYQVPVSTLVIHTKYPYQH